MSYAFIDVIYSPFASSLATATSSIGTMRCANPGPAMKGSGSIYSADYINNFVSGGALIYNPINYLVINYSGRLHPNTTNINPLF